jgi:phage regulator Rha-like protein
MFRLTAEEWENYLENWGLSQTVMTSGGADGEPHKIDDQPVGMSSQFVMTSQRSRGKANLPYAFTEHGVTMLASVLKSEKAVQMSIALIRAFIALKQIVTRQTGISDQLQEIWDRLGEHDVQLNSIYNAIENLLDEKANEKKWEDRPRIGFKR